MRIVSKFRDYYDGATRAGGYDKSFTFVRETRQEILLPRTLPYRDEATMRGRSVVVEPVIVGFCGKIYPCIRTKDHDYFGHKDAKECHYKMDDVLAEQIAFAYSGSRRFFLDSPQKKFARFFEDNHYQHKKFFFSRRCAYFSISAIGGETILTIYPSLSDLGFFKVRDSFSTAQDIERFLNNELVRRDEIDIQISDKLKAQSHGFNEESFRKPKKC
jgi:hypothetical protein